MAHPRKTFKPALQQEVSLPHTAPIPIKSLASSVVHFPPSATNARSFDFAPFYGNGIDAVTQACHQVVDAMIAAGVLQPPTIASYCYSGLKVFLPFCVQVERQPGGALTLRDIDSGLIEDFVTHLGIRPTRSGQPMSYRAQRSTYVNVKSVLIALCHRKLLPSPDVLFPKNPFPGASARCHLRQVEPPLSDTERQRVVKALGSDLSAISQGRFQGAAHEQLALGLLAIALRTGRNTIPLIELGRDAIGPHPLKDNRRLLRTVKRRGNCTHLTPLRFHESRETELSVAMDVVAIYERVRQMTADLVAEAPAHLHDRLWLYRTKRAASAGEVTALTPRCLYDAITALVNRHDLKRDDGGPLRVTPRLLRKTFENRLWRLSGGDLFLTARLAGHSVSVADRHYLAVSPEMLEEHRLAGEVLVQTLSDRRVADLAFTPIARCKDPLEGDLAPKTGQPCMDFLSCFRCHSFVVTGDDLYRLFSFYWLLIRERSRLGARPWARAYAWVIRVIDRDVAPQYEAAQVHAARERARVAPHPFWADRERLASLGALK